MPPKTRTFISINPTPKTITMVLKGKKTVSARAGVALVSERVKRIGELAPSGHPINLAMAFVIRKGDLVPKEFRGIPGIKVGPGGLASSAYTDSWCQSTWQNNSDWDRSWGECWDNSTARPDWTGVIINTAETRINAFSLQEFSSAELKTLAKFNLIR